MDRNVKQSEWLMAGGWRSRVVGQDHYRDHTTEPVLSPGNTQDYRQQARRDVATRQTAKICTKNKGRRSGSKSRNDCHSLVEKPLGKGRKDVDAARV